MEGFDITGNFKYSSGRPSRLRSEDGTSKAKGRSSLPVLGYVPGVWPKSSIWRRGQKRKPSRLQISTSHGDREARVLLSMPSGMRRTRSTGILGSFKRRDLISTRSFSDETTNFN